MNHLGHLLAADLRRHPMLLIAWILIVIASMVATGLTPTLSGDPTTRAVVGLLAELIWAASVVLMTLIVAMMIQIHPVVGSSAFWMTRPIPPLTLLTAKVILLAGAIVVLPGLAAVGLMGAFGVPIGQSLMIALQDVPPSAFLLVLLMSAAALTPTLPRFMLLCAGALGAAGVFVGILLAIAMAHFDENLYSSGPPAPDDPTGGIVLEILLILAALVLLRTQYRTRSRLRALGVGAVAVCLAIVIAELWPWPLLRITTETPGWANHSSMLQLTGVPASLRVDASPAFRSRSLWRIATADVRLSGIEAGWSASVTPSASSLEVAGGVVWKTPGGLYPQRVVSEDDSDGTDHAAFRSILGVDRVLLTSHTPVRAMLLAMKDVDFQRLPSTAATFRTVAYVSLTRNYLEAVLPLTPSAQFHADAHHVVVDGIDRRPQAVAVYMRDSDAHSVFQRKPWAPTQYFLRNRTAHEAVLATSAAPDDSASFSLLRLVNASAGQTSGFAARSWTIQFERANRSGAPAWRLDDHWLNSAELVIVRSVPEGSVSRSLEISGLDIRNAPPSEPQ